MIAWGALKTAIYDWVSTETAITTIWANQNAPQPDTPYITLNIIAGPVKLGLDDDMVWDSVGAQFILAGQRRFTTSIQAYGNGSLSAMSNLLGSIDKPSVHDGLSTAKLAIANTPAIIDLTAMLSTAFEDRRGMDVEFYTVDNTAITLSYIDKTELEGFLTTPKGSVINPVFTVPPT
jgi:hypothetical protein